MPNACVSSYPLEFENVNLSKLEHFKKYTKILVTVVTKVITTQLPQCQWDVWLLKNISLLIISSGRDNKNAILQMI